MRKLEIDWGELELAFDNGSYEMSYCLDLETGKVPVVTEDDRDNLETSADDLQDWEKQAAEQARAIEEGEGERYVSVPRRARTRATGPWSASSAPSPAAACGIVSSAPGAGSGMETPGIPSGGWRRWVVQ